MVKILVKWDPLFWGGAAFERPFPIKTAHSGHGAVWFSAFDWGSKGRWFESSCPDFYGTPKGVPFFLPLFTAAPSLAFPPAPCYL